MYNYLYSFRCCWFSDLSVQLCLVPTPQSKFDNSCVKNSTSCKGNVVSATNSVNHYHGEDYYSFE